MVTCVQYHANVSKQTKLLDAIDDGPSKWQVCGRGLDRSVHGHEGMKDISNVKVHLKTRSGNVNIQFWNHIQSSVKRKVTQK